MSDSSGRKARKLAPFGADIGLAAALGGVGCRTSDSASLGSNPGLPANLERLTGTVTRLWRRRGPFHARSGSPVLLWPSPARRHGSKITSGFPIGGTGAALRARACNQAQRLSAEIAIPDEVDRRARHADPNGNRLVLTLRGSGQVSRAIVNATSARYRRLNIPDLAAFEVSSVHYWAWPLDPPLCVRQGGGTGRGHRVDWPMVRRLGRQRLDRFADHWVETAHRPTARRATMALRMRGSQNLLRWSAMPAGGGLLALRRKILADLVAHINELVRRHVRNSPARCGGDGRTI